MTFSAASSKKQKSGVLDDFFSDDVGSDFGLDDDEPPRKGGQKAAAKAALAGSRDGLDSLFDGNKAADKTTDSADTGASRFKLDSFTARLSSTKKDQAARSAVSPPSGDAGVVAMPAAKPKKDEDGYVPSDPGSGGYMPSASGGDGSRRSVGLLSSAAADSRTLPRPSTAPGRRPKQVHFDDGTSDQRPASVPPKTQPESQPALSSSKPAASDDDLLGMLGPRRQQRPGAEQSAVQGKPESL